MTNRKQLTKFAWLSIAAAITTIALKTGAYLITDSVGLLSDALESTVNLVAAIGALIALTIAARPPDEFHTYGHAKAEYFSALAEGLMIIVAAATIAWSAIDRLMNPQAIEEVGLGLTITLAAAVINMSVALILRRAGRDHNSITLTADAQHLMTDVWTSAGVIVAVAAVALTGWERLDPIIALVVAANIVIAGIRLIRRSSQGLMDVALEPADLAAIQEVLDRHRSPSTQFHGMRTRQAGSRAFMTIHVLVPGAWPVRRAHDLVEVIEDELREGVDELTVTTHIEPLEDPRSFSDENLDRRKVPPSSYRPPPTS